MEFAEAPDPKRPDAPTPAGRFDAFVDALWRDLEAGAPKPVADYALRFSLDRAIVEAEVAAVEEARTTAPGSPPEAFGRAAFRIGEYAILRKLGRGGFADVWLGRSLATGRLAAIKVLRARMRLSAYAEAKFQSETKITSQLDHPTICKVFEHGVSEDGTPWFAMEYVRGETLAEWIDRQRRGGRDDVTLHESFGDERPPSAAPMPADSTRRVHEPTPTRADLEQLVAIGETTARGLHEAHRRGVVHRDVKPGNIMLRASDRAPVVLDFGLALDLSNQDERLTATNETVGTHLYMAPERLSGRADDPRIDVWSLGLSLYEALTLHNPFRAPTLAAVADRIRTAPIPDPRKLNRSISDDLAVVLRTALARDPARRYATAEAFADDLRAVLEKRPIKAKPPNVFVRANLWARRNPAVSILGALVVASLSAGLWMSIDANARLRSESANRATSDARAKAAALGYAAAAALERDPALAALAAAASLDAAAAAGLPHDPDVNGVLLRGAARVAEDRAFFGVHAPTFGGGRAAWVDSAGRAIVAEATAGVVFEHRDGPPVVDVALSDDGARIAIVDAALDLRVVEVATRRTLAETRLKSPPTSVALVGDGRAVVLGGASAPTFLEVATGVGRTLEPPSGFDDRSFLPPRPVAAGDYVFSADARGYGAWYRVGDGTFVAGVAFADVGGERPSNADVAIAPDGASVVAVYDGRATYARLLPDKTTRTAVVQDSGVVRAVCFGERVALLLDDGSINCGTVDDATATFVLRRTIDAPRGPRKPRAIARDFGGASFVVSDGRALRVFDVKGSPLSRVDAPDLHPSKLSFAGAETVWAAVAHGGEDARLLVFDLRAPSPVLSGLSRVLPFFEPRTGRVVSRDQDGKPVVSATDPDAAASDAFESARAFCSLGGHRLVDPFGVARSLSRAAWTSDGEAFFNCSGSDAPLIARYDRDGRDGFMRTGTGARLERIPDVWRPAGERLVAVLAHDDGAESTNTSGVYDVLNGLRYATWPDPDALGAVLESNRRGDRVLAAAASFGTLLYDPKRSEPVARLSEAKASAADFSCDDAKLATASPRDFGASLIEIRAAEDGAPLATIEIPSVVRDVAWTASDRLVVIAGNDVFVFDAEGRREARLASAGRDAFAAAGGEGFFGLVGAYGIVRTPVDRKHVSFDRLRRAARPEDLRRLNLGP